MSNKTLNALAAVTALALKPFTRIVAVLVVVAASLLLVPHKTSTCGFEDTYKIISVRHLSTTIHTAVANTEPLRELGLGKRDCIKPDQGMLFEFTNAQKYSFWMSNMRFAIDIIWLDQDKKIVSIAYEADPSSYPQTYEPDAPAMYVLEVPSGKALQYHFAKGTQLSW